jgi:hypothetical protein
MERDRQSRLIEWYRETAALALKLESESDNASPQYHCEGCGGALYRDSGRFCHECLLFVGDSLSVTQSLQRRIEAAEALLRKHVDLREMQRQRESEVFHISVTTFLALWDKLDKETRKALSPPMKDSE